MNYVMWQYGKIDPVAHRIESYQLSFQLQKLDTEERTLSAFCILAVKRKSGLYAILFAGL